MIIDGSFNKDGDLCITPAEARLLARDLEYHATESLDHGLQICSIQVHDSKKHKLKKVIDILVSPAFIESEI